MGVKINGNHFAQVRMLLRSNNNIMSSSIMRKPNHIAMKRSVLTMLVGLLGSRHFLSYRKYGV